MLGNRALGAGALIWLGAVALAHNGATGVVMDRMMGMTAMKDVMASLAPMMRGETPFEVRTAQEAALQIIAHSGDNMNRLFPEGSLQTASYAKPEIWTEWEDFAALSEQLKTYGIGLAMAAPNGLTAPTSAMAASDSGAMDHSTMQMEVPEPPSSGMVDHSMMQMETSEASTSSGSGTMDHSTMQMEAPEPSGSGIVDHSMMQMETPSGTTTQEAPVTKYSVAELMGVVRPDSLVQTTSSASTEEVIDFALLAADDAFEMISQTCSSCHARFRTGN